MFSIGNKCVTIKYRYKNDDGLWPLMIDPQTIRGIVNRIKARRQSWRVSRRSKNTVLVSILAVDQSEILDIIFRELSWRDYSYGPIMDDHQPPRPGDIWVFSLAISGIDCYLKFQDKPSGVVMWISIHPIEHPLNLPYK